MPAAPAGDRRVMSDGKDALGRIPQAARSAVRSADVFDAAAEPDRVFGIEALELPRVAECKPALRRLLLPAVPDLLHEQTVLVADAIAKRWDRERRHAVYVASGETAEP